MSDDLERLVSFWIAVVVSITLLVLPWWLGILYMMGILS